MTMKLKAALTVLLIVTAHPAWATGAGQPIQEFKGEGLFSSWFGSPKETPDPSSKAASEEKKKAEKKAAE